MIAGAVTAGLCMFASAILLFTFRELVTEYLGDEVSAAGGRVAMDLERGSLVNPLTDGQIHDMQVLDAGRRVVAATARLQGRPPMTELVPPDGDRYTQSVLCDTALPGEGCHIVVARQVYHSGQNWTIYSASSEVPPLLHPGLVVLLAASTVLFVAVVTYSSYRVVTAALNPVHTIQEELEEINETTPDRRVPVRRHPDEFHDLASSVNHTLERLQAAVEQQRRFASDASHDLRSPITSMRAQVEEALMLPGATSVQTMSASLLGGLDRLEGIVSDLLTIARLDAGLPGSQDLVDLGALVDNELRDRRFTKAVRRELADGVLVVGDRMRLARLLGNLLDNAERHAGHEVTVKVYAERVEGDPAFPEGAAVLEVLDDGDGIPPDKRDLVFQRFTRLPDAVGGDAHGTGLGLPIARQIAEATGGTLTLAPSARGARFVLRLPPA
ncbi:HAMP domain-containing sensor histidine kinase [Sphaerisporangium sp. TRM90804]|uniref:sensor histidine kinase n=1 Tax=Sphaerisporangium sp. TRM90804 TaxID=3031113 RepID=UPI00244B9725|nr:HAMP domain-containing sensor histidine kinase [Sphaerisporangium sp. TRM90804]MDH2429463.1 HAMP domain-containing sensor histidine kinase [Sphaerisporangium sp. TRM90804]